MNNPKARILIVEDDPAIRRGLLDVFVFNGYDVVGIEDGGEGLAKGRAERFDLIMLDVMLPTMDGFAICRAIRQEKPAQAIMMLTAKGAEDDIVDGFSAGADDYVSKPFSLRELMVRVEALLRRVGKAAGDDNFTIGPLAFDPIRLKVSCDGKGIELTRREIDIISYLRRNPDRIISKQELLTEVWHYAVSDIETRTVDIHILKLRKKIDSLIGDRPFIVTVRGEGYRLEALDETI
ncbi:MAG: response regulator transcription factor [Proteobacteria bacterium]|nr:response regulator transcription factor [Pseudomonadota bacterium]MBU1716236.1 response regulator transcription factor [Pseudomonadota bacterium]